MKQLTLLVVSVALLSLACGRTNPDEGFVFSVDRTSPVPVEKAGIVHVLVHTAQSDGIYKGRGEAGSLPSVRYWYSVNDGACSSGAAFIDLTGNDSCTGGADYTIGSELSAAGFRVAIISLTYGATRYIDWMVNESAGEEGRLLIQSFDGALAALRDGYPADTQFAFHHLRNQGQTDARADDLQYQTGEPAPYKYGGWAYGTEDWHQTLLSHMVSAGYEPAMDRYAVMTYTGISGTHFVPALQRQQLIWVGGTPDEDPTIIGDHPRLLKLEEPSAYDSPDGLHMVATPIAVDGQSYGAGGYQWEGQVVAAALRADWGAP